MCIICKDRANLHGYKQISKEQWEDCLYYFRKQFKRDVGQHVFYGIPYGFARHPNVLAVHCTATDCKELVPGKSEVDCLVVKLCESELQFFRGSHAYLKCPYTYRYNLFEQCLDNLKYKFDYSSQLARAALQLMFQLKGLNTLDPIELVVRLVGDYLSMIDHELDMAVLNHKLAMVKELLKK